MTSTLQALIDRFCPPSLSWYRIVISGSESSGKTTLLYWLKMGEIVRTIPSIGTNIESFDVHLPRSNQKLPLAAWDLGQGCSRGMRWTLLLNMQMYLHGAKALIWMVDCSKGEEELKESAETLAEVMQLWDTKICPRESLPLLILANKVDLPNPLSLDRVRTAFAAATKDQITSVFHTSVTTQQGLTEAFEWLSLALSIASNVKTSDFSSSSASSLAGGFQTAAQLREPSLLAKRLEEWLHRAEDEEKELPAEEFIKKYEAYDLPVWDHYTHIRLAYLLLMAHGRQKGKDLVFNGLADYIANSPHTRVKGYHCSMTYFWIQMVHFGIRNTPPSLVEFTGPDSPSKTPAASDLPSSVPEGEGEGEEAIRYPSSADFFRFLLVNPHLVDGNLWTDYYSREVLMSPEAKAGMVLPDKKPLPSLVVRDAVKTFGNR